MSYPIPLAPAIAEIEVKKSRFIAYANHIETRQAGLDWLAVLKKQYPDARHHCWAYQIGNPSCASNAGMGDDGEPSGTAGKPILNVLQHKGVGDIMIVVVRFFGGIKLGAGGLTRAYGQAAQAVMEVLPTQQQIEQETYNVKCDFSQEQQIRYLVSQALGHIEEVNYLQRVTMVLKVPKIESKTFMAQLEANQCLYQLYQQLDETD